MGGGRCSCYVARVAGGIKTGGGNVELPAVLLCMYWAVVRGAHGLDLNQAISGSKTFNLA